MLKNIVLLITAFVCAQVFAEPMKMASKSELASAKKAAEGLLTSGVSADQVFEYAEEAKKSAEKYQLYCTAFKLYAKEEKAEEAAKVIDKIQSEFSGVPDKDIVSMIEQYAKKLAKENEELGAALSVSKMRASASSQLSKAKKELKKNPNSVEHKYLIAEAHAVLGDWKSALKQFKDAGGVVWQVASEELAGDVSAKIAAFWWDYKPRSKFNAEPAFKAHSAALYEKLLKDGELSILEKATAESRIEQAGHLGATKPKSELDKLKKICNTKGLVNCWRFNGSLNNVIEGKDAAAMHGSDVKLGDKQVVLTQGNVYLHNMVTGCYECTIEIWGGLISERKYSRIFNIGLSRSRNFHAAWNWDCKAKSSYVAVYNPGYNKANLAADYDLGREYHIAVVVKRVPGASTLVTYYQQDAQTGKTLAKTDLKLPEYWDLGQANCPHGWLGWSNYGDPTANAAYNEVRIWNRALSEEELTQNAIKFHKAGETMKK